MVMQSKRYVISRYLILCIGCNIVISLLRYESGILKEINQKCFPYIDILPFSCSYLHQKPGLSLSRYDSGIGRYLKELVKEIYSDFDFKNTYSIGRIANQ